MYTASAVRFALDMLEPSMSNSSRAIRRNRSDLGSSLRLLPCYAQRKFQWSLRIKLRSQKRKEFFESNPTRLETTSFNMIINWKWTRYKCPTRPCSRKGVRDDGTQRREIPSLLASSVARLVARSLGRSKGVVRSLRFRLR